MGCTDGFAASTVSIVRRYTALVLRLEGALVPAAPGMHDYGEGVRGPGARAPSPDEMDINPSEVERALPDYKVIRKLGNGNFGAVFEAEHRNTKHRVAIKAIHMHRQSLEATRKEVAALRKLSNHSHIVTILKDPEKSGDLREDGLLTIVMELLHETLRQRLAEAPNKIIPPDQACAIALGVALALEQVESTNIVHRDIKPGNIMFATDGTVKVTDLGIAKTFEGTSTTVDEPVGTPHYMAPEQWGGRGSRIRSVTDIYALGIVCYRMVSGCLPFDSTDLNELSRLHRKVPPPPLPDSVPVQIAKVIYNALEKQQARRPSAHAFACALATAATAEYGPHWTDGTGIRLHLSQELKEIIAGPTQSVHLSQPSNGSGRRWWMAAITGALALCGIMAPLVCSSKNVHLPKADPKHCGLSLTDSNYNSVTTEPYGCVGISSDIRTFHVGQTNNPNENLEDVGNVIMSQNQQVSGEQPVTLVYVAALTDPPDQPLSQESPRRVAKRESLMGIAAAQLLNNTQFRPPVSILFANAGAQMQGASTIGMFLKTLVAGGNPRHIIGVVGPEQSRTDTVALVDTLATLGIPTVAPTLSLDSLADSHRTAPYFQIGPQDRLEATAMATYAKDILVPKGSYPGAVILTSDDTNDLYPPDLTHDLQEALPLNGLTVQKMIPYQAMSDSPKDPKNASISQVAMQLCHWPDGKASDIPYPGIVFFDGRSDDFKNLRHEVVHDCDASDSSGRSQYPTIVADDDIADLLADPRNRNTDSALTFYYVSFVDPTGRRVKPCDQLSTNMDLYGWLCKDSVGIDASLDEQALLYFDAVNVYLSAERSLGQASFSWQAVGDALRNSDFSGASGRIIWKGSLSGAPSNRAVVILKETIDPNDLKKGAAPTDPVVFLGS